MDNSGLWDQFFRWLGSDVAARRMWILMMDLCLEYVCIHVRHRAKGSFVYIPTFFKGVKDLCFAPGMPMTDQYTM